jgi:Cu-processing system permease protein
MVFTSAFNPVDLCRILILLRMDVSALMGYTGAVFKDFFGSQAGSLVAIVVLLLWVMIPVWLSTKKFQKKDL